MPTSFRFTRTIVSLLLLLFLASCAGGPVDGLAGLLSPTHGPPSHDLIADYRLRYQTEREPDALDWLLANAIEQGMRVAEVGEVFGEKGERVFNDRRMKTKGGHYRATDIAYRWGPDSNGRSVYLFFREGRLLNFDPEEFRE